MKNLYQCCFCELCDVMMREMAWQSKVVYISYPKKEEAIQVILFYNEFRSRIFIKLLRNIGAILVNNFCLKAWNESVNLIAEIMNMYEWEKDEI